MDYIIFNQAMEICDFNNKQNIALILIFFPVIHNSIQHYDGCITKTIRPPNLTPKKRKRVNFV